MRRYEVQLIDHPPEGQNGRYVVAAVYMLVEQREQVGSTRSFGNEESALGWARALVAEREAGSPRVTLYGLEAGEEEIRHG